MDGIMERLAEFGQALLGAADAAGNLAEEVRESVTDGMADALEEALAFVTDDDTARDVRQFVAELRDFQLFDGQGREIIPTLADMSQILEAALALARRLASPAIPRRGLKAGHVIAALGALAIGYAITR